MTEINFFFNFSTLARFIAIFKTFRLVKLKLTFLPGKCSTKLWRDSGHGWRIEAREHHGVVVARSHHWVRQDHVLEDEPVLADVGGALLDGVHAHAGHGGAGVVCVLDVCVVCADS